MNIQSVPQNQDFHKNAKNDSHLQHHLGQTNPDAFNNVLQNVAQAVMAPEELEKQRLSKNKELIEDGAGMVEEETEAEFIVKKVKKLKKAIKDLAKFERHNLGL